MTDQLGFDANLFGMKSPKIWIVSELAHLSFLPPFPEDHVTGKCRQTAALCGGSDTTYEEKHCVKRSQVRRGSVIRPVTPLQAQPKSSFPAS